MKILSGNTYKGERQINYFSNSSLNTCKLFNNNQKMLKIIGKEIIEEKEVGSEEETMG